MPNHDFSSANSARVAGQMVDRLRIANQDIWQPASTENFRLLSTFTPPNSNAPGLYSYGMLVSRTTPFKALGGYWYFLTGGPTSITVRYHNPVTEAILASNVVSTTGFVNATWEKVPLLSPYSSALNTEYLIVMEADGETGFDSGLGLPLSEAGFTVHEGRYLSDGGFPTNVWSGLHGIGLNWSE